MSSAAAEHVGQDEIEVLRGAVFSMCAEHRIALKSQEGISLAGTAISLFCAGYRTQETLRDALCGDKALDLAWA